MFPSKKRLRQTIILNPTDTMREGTFSNSAVVPIIGLISHCRDALVAGAIGERQFDGVKYTTTAQTIEGLLPVGTQGINHSESREIPIVS